MVAQLVLVQLVEVRILTGEPLLDAVCDKADCIFFTNFDLLSKSLEVLSISRLALNAARSVCCKL